MEIAKATILASYIIFVVIIVAFNLLYSARTIRANKKIGLYVPKYISLLVKISNLLALITAILSGIFLLTQSY
jgi:heme/copper-type cytochrome/quinol oxidase subunit 2